MGHLERLGAGDSIVWEYDFAWDKNIREPLEFLFLGPPSSERSSRATGYSARSD